MIGSVSSVRKAAYILVCMLLTVCVSTSMFWLRPSKDELAARRNPASLSLETSRLGRKSIGRIVFVRSLPDTPQFEYEKGRYFDLGYLHMLGDGRWIGYLPPSKKNDVAYRFVELDQDAMPEVLSTLGVGLHDVPDPPRSWYWRAYAQVASRVLCVAIVIGYASWAVLTLIKRVIRRGKAVQAASHE